MQNEEGEIKPTNYFTTLFLRIQMKVSPEIHIKEQRKLIWILFQK